eukprot:3125420-Rhodomonas_salina.1
MHILSVRYRASSACGQTLTPRQVSHSQEARATTASAAAATSYPGPAHGLGLRAAALCAPDCD